MKLFGYITTGIEKTGSVKAVAENIGVNRTHLADAKAGRRGLPLLACVRLAHLINADPLNVIVASQLVTETDEKKRKEWTPFLTNEWRRGWDSNPR